MLRMRPPSLCPLRLDFDIDGNLLTDARHCLGSRGKHQIEIAPGYWIRRDCPARLARVVNGCQQFYMQRDWLCHPVHREIAENIAGLRSGLLNAPAFKRNSGIFLYVKKLRAAEMIVPFFNARVDAANIDLSRNRRIRRMLAINIDSTAEHCELPLCRAKKLMHRKSNRGAGRIELVDFLC